MQAAAGAPRAHATIVPTDPYPRAAAAYLVAVNGVVLWAREPQQPLPPASLAKLMTALVLAEQQQAKGTAEVSRLAAAATGSRLGLRAGDQLHFSDAFDALLVASGNDVCLALAEHAAGSVAAFVTRMNERARQFGLTATRFANPCGLDAPGQVASAADLHALVRLAMAVPAIAHAVALPAVDIQTLGGRRLRKSNSNLLIGRVPGAVGVKSGFTNRAGKCLTALVRRGSDEVLIVLLNAPNRWWSAQVLIDDAFAALDASRR